jgi:hypothetical protein
MMIKNILVAAAFAATAFAAQANEVANGSFAGTTGDYVYNGVAPSIASAMPGFGSTPGTVADWTGSFVSIASTSGAWGTPAGLSGADGSLGGYVAGIQSDGTLSQSLDLAAGTYLLSWIDANRGNDQTYSVSLTGGTVSYLGSTAFATTAGAGWNTEELLFTTTGGVGALTFTGGTIWGQSDSTSFIDNVSLSAVPESSSLMMMAMGTLGLLAWRRRAQV